MSEGALDFDAPDNDGLSNVELDVENSAEFHSGQQQDSNNNGTYYGGQSEGTESKSGTFQVPTHCGGPNAAVWNAILQQVRGGKENCPVVGYMQLPMIGGDPSAGPCTFGFSFGNAKQVSPDIQPFCMTNPCQQGQFGNNAGESSEDDSSEESSDDDDESGDDEENGSISYGNHSGGNSRGYYGKGSGYGGYGSYPGTDYYYGGGYSNNSHSSKKAPKNDRKDPKETKNAVLDTTAPPQTMQPFMGVVPQCTQAAECPKVDLPRQWPPQPCKVTANDEEGLNFNFKPRKDFATEVTFTIEPKKKPLWQKMMQCGFRPMITCAAPPFRLPADFQGKKKPEEEGTKDGKEDKRSKKQSSRTSSKSRSRGRRGGKGSDNSSSYVIEESVRQYDGSYSSAYSTSDQGSTTQSSSGSSSATSRSQGRRGQPETSSYNYSSGYSYPGSYGSSHGSNYYYSPHSSNYYSSYPSYQTYSVGYSYEDSYYDYYASGGSNYRGTGDGRGKPLGRRR